MSVSTAIIPYQDPWDTILPQGKKRPLPIPKTESKDNYRSLQGRVKRLLLGVGIFSSMIKSVRGYDNTTVTHADRMLIIETMGSLSGFIFICLMIMLFCMKCRPNPIERDIENQQLLEDES